MKKFTKIIAAALCLLTVCLMLCSCQYLDDAKANTAVYTDSSMKMIAFRNQQYRMIELPVGRSFIMSEVQSNRYVTPSDVPVLLSRSFGDTMLYDAAGEDPPVIIRVNRVNTNRYDSRLEAALADDFEEYRPVTFDQLTTAYYVREDRFQAVKAIVDDAEPDRYCAIVRTYVDPTAPWKGEKDVPTLLDESATEAIKRTLSEKNIVSWNDLTDTEWYGIYLLMCDETLTLSNNMRFLEVLTNGNDYYLFYSDDVNRLYHVSNDDFQVMRKVYKMCENNLEYMDINYYRSQADRISETNRYSP